MSYQVLARKWRPKAFSNLKGQEQVTRALSNALKQNKIHHAYLFTGTRGVGKTTAARILAKSLNCLTGITPEPCGQCEACIAIDSGNFVDLIEVDGASRTRVEDTRELLENVQYLPSLGRFKIYLIDEVHMLSGHSFNALLKTLEEPPAHVIFILATTEPDRIPITVLSRCLRLNLRPISLIDIIAQLEMILADEKLLYETEALTKLARQAKGSMRDALSLLEQAIVSSPQKVTAQAVDEMLGMYFQRYMPALLTHLIQQNVSGCLALTEEIAKTGADFTEVLSSVLQMLHSLSVAQMVPEAKAPIEVTVPISPEEVQLMYQIGLTGQRDLPYAPSPQIGFEMILLKMIVFRPTDFESPEPIVVAQPVAIPQPVVVAVQPVAVPQSADLNWGELIPTLSLSGFSLMLAKNTMVLKWEQDKLDLVLDESQKAGLSAERQAQIETAVSKHFGRKVRVSISVGEVKSSPMQQEQAQTQAHYEEAKNTLAQNQTVQSILSTFDATIEKMTVTEKERG